MSLLQKYVSDPRNDGTYELHLGPKETEELWKAVDALAADAEAYRKLIPVEFWSPKEEKP